MAGKTLESTSTFPSTHEVFLNFRGEDTRKNIISHLYAALVRAGLRTYKDDEDLERGEEIGPSLCKAIQQSRISIPVFSTNYASSTWCLQELTEIMECRVKNSQIVLPVFFSANPSDVRKQSGSFKEPFLAHEKKFEKETVDRWRNALTEAANLSGQSLQDIGGDEAELIELIVNEVLIKLNYNTHLFVSKYPVGIDSHVEHMMSLLNVESGGVLFVGICGMGGIGKTTIAKAVFNQIFGLFDGRVFLEDVSENSKKLKDQVSLQKKLVFNILKKKLDIDDVNRGIEVIRKRGCGQKVLIVLDNVDNKTQLDFLAGGTDWFGLGSRIIITSRDQQVLTAHGVDKIFWPTEMSPEQSLELFCKHAFGRDQRLSEVYMDLAKEIVDTTGGLPLAIEVLGSFFAREGKEYLSKKETIRREWKAALDELKIIPNIVVRKKLKISYLGLDHQWQEMFLDIACFFIGMDKETVIKIWNGCGFSSEMGLSVLTRKSLVKIGDRNELRMHDQLRDMGREIVREDGGRDPGKYSRLWDHVDVFDVLKKQMGSTNVKGLILHFENVMYQSSGFGPTAMEEGRLRIEAFAAMSQLRLLRVDFAHLDGDFEHFPPKLSWLSWRGCPLEFIPTNFRMEKLTVLDLSFSCSIKQVWNEWHQNQVVKTLEVLDLSWCTNLIRTPDFSGFPCLEILNLQSCPRLEEVHRSIGNLKKLIYLNLSCCESLAEVPSSIFKLDSLEILVLAGCSTLKKLPDSDGMKSLRELYLDTTAIEQLPESIGCLKNLSVLKLQHCQSLRILPNSLGKLESLRELFLDGTAVEQLPDSIGCLKNVSFLSLGFCKSLRILPDSLGELKSLRELSLHGTAIEQLPDSIGCLENLSLLSLNFCKSLRILPNSLGELKYLRKLFLDGTGIEQLPESIGCLKNLSVLTLQDCESLRILPNSIGALKKLEILSLRDCGSLTVLPNSIGDLESLSDLQLSGSAVHELPSSIGCLLKLPRLSIKHCNFLGKIPDTLWRIESLIELKLAEMDKIREIPEFHGSQSKLGKLTIRFCKSFSRLPDSLGDLESLRVLILDETPIENIPDSIGSLKKLEILSTRLCKSLTNLPDSISNVRNLTTLVVDGTLVTELPNGIGSFEKLEKLSASKCKKLVELPDSMGHLRLLKEFNMAETGIVKLPENFGMLQSLKVLDMSGCQEFKGLPENFASLSQVDVLKLAYCTKLQYLPELPSSLVELDVTDCISLERLPDLSNLEKLEVLTLSYCEKLLEIEGIERLKSLSELSMIGCNINRNTLRKIFVQGAFECLQTFSFPGSDIPDWFAHQEFPSVVCIPPDYEIDRLIVCGIFSREDGYLERRWITCPFSFIKAGKFVCYGRTIRGIPKTNEDQVCLFYYQPGDYLLHNWKNGDEINFLINTESGGTDCPGIYGKKVAVHVAYRLAVRGLESKAMEDDKQLSHIKQKLADFYTCDAGGGSQHSAAAPESTEATMPIKKRKLSIRDRDTPPPRSRRHGRAISVRNIHLGCWLRLSMRRMLSGKKARRDEPTAATMPSKKRKLSIRDRDTTPPRSRRHGRAISVRNIHLGCWLRLSMRRMLSGKRARRDVSSLRKLPKRG